MPRALKHPVTLIALAVWLAAWGRLIYVHEARPAPTRYTPFFTEAGRLDSIDFPYCHSPRLITGSVIWSHCYKTPASEAMSEGFIRFDLEAGRADALWPADLNHQGARAFAVAPDGDVLVIQSPLRVLRLRAGGGVASLGAPESLSAQPLGVAVVDGALEIIGGGFGAPALHRRPLEEGGWSTFPWPAALCPEGIRCRAASARHSEGAWRVSYVAWPEAPPVEGEVVAEVSESVSGGPLQPRHALPLDRARAWQRYEEHTLRGEVHLEDDASGVPLARADLERTHVFERHGDAWRPLAPPTEGIHTPEYMEPADLALHEGAYTARLAVGSRHDLIRVGGRWLQIHDTPEGQRLGVHGQAPGPVIADDGWLTSDPVLALDGEGGLWWLGAFGSYVRVDPETFERLDAPGFFARVGLLYENFRRLDAYNDFWLELPALKAAIFPSSLLLLPLLIALAAWRRRLDLLPKLALLSLLVTLAGGWWFWRMTSWF